jgi:GT2 family glycosyltransferase
MAIRTDAGLQSAPAGLRCNAGRWQCVVALPEPSRELGLEDGAPGGVPLQRGAVRKLSRLGASVRMLLALRDAEGRPDWRTACGLAAMAMTALGPARRRTFAQRLADRYRDGPPRGAPVFLSAPEPAPVAPPPPAQTAWVRSSPVPGSGLAAALAPSGDLRQTAGAGDVWEAIGEDPQLHLALPRPLPGGWYRFRARLRVQEGEVNSPCLYPDYGSGLDQTTQIVLPAPDASGRIHAVVLLKHEVRHLRFDPSIRRTRFQLANLRIERLTRGGAALRMLAALRRGLRPDAPALGAAVTDSIRSLAAQGARRAGETLHRHYQAYCWPQTGTYDSWVRMYDTITPDAVQAMRERASALRDAPLVSVLLPVYQTPERWLRRCIESVLAQAYPRWELCIADDASPSQRVRDILREYARLDPRIRVEFRASNGHISEASNTALAMARGTLVALLDHDDELRPHSLLEMVEAFARHPETRLAYSDEDKVDERGRRFDPYFKPDWNPDLLLAQNYLCHLTVIDTALAREAGGFRDGFEGSQDHDLFLRCCERLDDAQVRHVPKVLYHWRAVPGSTALRRDAKDYAAAAGARAVNEHLERIGASASVEQLPHGHYRVRWPLPVPAPRVSIVIPTRDKASLLRTCVESLLGANRYPSLEVLVVDNQSSEPDALELLEQLAADERVRVLRYDAPFNFSRMNNMAVAEATGDVVVLVNNDIEVLSGDSINEVVSHAIRPGIGAVGAMLRYPDGSIQHAGVVLGVGGIANHPFQHQPRGYPGHGARAMVAHNFSAVTAAFLAIRRDTYLEAGGLDERLAVAFNDVDFCLRVRALGYRNLWTPFVDIIHHESASRGREDTPEKQARFQQEVEFMRERWAGILHADPNYNPNLTLETVNFELAFPPRS